MLKKIDFQKKIQCTEPFSRNTNFTEKKWRTAPASSRDSVNFCRIDKKGRNGAKLEIALFNVLHVKEDRLSKKFWMCRAIL